MDSARPPHRLFAAAAVPALCIALLYGLGDLGLYLHGIGRLPTPLLPPSCLLLYSAGGFACATAAWLLTRMTGGGPRRAGAAGVAISLAVLLGATLFLRLLPERVSLFTPLGAAVALLLLALALGSGALAGRYLPPVRSGRRPLIIYLGAVTLITALAFALPHQYSATPAPPAPTATAAPLSPPPPNILLIVLDTLRADRLGRPLSAALAAATSGTDSAAAAPTTLTPNLDAFAREAVTFTRTLSVSNHTPPPHASLLTGVYPSRHGVNDKAVRFPRANLTLPERLRPPAWTTFAVVANDQLQPYMGWEQGFQLYDDTLIASTSAAGWANETPLGMLLQKFHLPPGRLLLSLANALHLVDHPTAGRVVDRTLHHIDQISGEQHFFALLNFMEPHYPYLPPGVEVPHGATHINRLLHAALGHGFVLPDDFDPEIVAELRTLYDGEVRTLDQQLGRLFSALRERDLLRNTLVIVTADHGELLGEHNYMLHAYTMYKEVLDVPLIIRPPDSWAGALRDRLDPTIVSTVDIAATILAAAGVAADPGEMEGVSLLPRLRRSAADSLAHQAVAQWYSRRLVAWGPYRAHFKGGKLQRITTGGDDLSDISADHPELVREAYNRLQRWQAMVSGDDTVAPDARPPDRALRNRLRALGYVD